MRLILISFLFVSLTVNCWGGELKHIISDGEFWYKGIFEERASCIEEEHLEIDLPEKEWNKIKGIDIDFKRVTHFSATLCIKCRLISVSCAGNDWFRYILVIKQKEPTYGEVLDNITRGLDAAGNVLE